MKRLAPVLTLISAMAIAVAVGNPLLSGRGILEFETMHGEGRASFEAFAQKEGKTLVGRLLFSAEGIHLGQEPALSSGEPGYPDIVVTAESLGSVVVNGNVATIRSKARLHMEPVVILVVLTDSRSKTEPDRFALRCDRPTGEHLFHVEGPLLSGGIDLR